MPVSPRVLSLLLQFEELQGQGHTITPEELCRDCPELLDEVRGQLRDLHQANLRLGLRPDTARPAGTPGEASTAADLPAALPLLPGYEVLEELGRGGMGVVYKARQVRLNRLVALKMILSGVHAGSSEVARFRQEAEALARMQHPHIVQVHEIGDQGGRPFLTLEFVEGGSLEDKLQGTPQPPDQAAELTEVLARAVDAAHQRGIIHRDLKPANVLLTGHGQPKISDFGLAKQLDAQREHTISGAILGTPSYMAPEQASGKTREVGPAADLYALGAILYELLTGRPPFKAAAPWDTLVQVLTDEPVPPTRLQPKVPRDLETICLKCLRKEPAKRYASAAELADDLYRFREGKPITARPVGRVERGWRWCRRQPLAAGLLGALLLVFLTGFAGVTWKWREAENYHRQAVGQRDRAQTLFDFALDTNVNVAALADQLKPIAGTQASTVKTILDQAAANYERLLREAGETPRLLAGKARMLNSFSEVYVSLGDTSQALRSGQEAKEIFDRLLEQEPDNAKWQGGLAASLQKIGVAHGWQGDLSRCMASYRGSLAIRERLAQKYPENTDWQRDLAGIQGLMGQNLLTQHGDTARGCRMLEQAFALSRKLADAAPTNRDHQSRLAVAYRMLGDGLWYRDGVPPALKAYEEAGAIYRRLIAADRTNVKWQQSLAGVTTSVGQAHKTLGDGRKARGAFEEALGIAQRVLALDPGDVDRQREVMRCKLQLADLRKGEDVVLALKEKRPMLLQLEAQAGERARKDPRNAEWQGQFASLKWNLARTCAGLAGRGVTPAEHYATARKLLGEALALLIPLVERSPAHSPFAHKLALAHYSLGDVLAAQGEAKAARHQRVQYNQVLLDFYKRQVAREPDNATWEAGLGRTYRSLGLTRTIQGDHAASLEAHQDSLACFQRLRQREPDKDAWLREQAVAYFSISQALTAAGLKNDSRDLDALRQSVELREQLVRRQPRNADWQRELAEGYAWLAGGLASRDDRASRAAFARFLDAQQHYFELRPDEARLDPLARSTPLSLALAAMGPLRLPQRDLHRIVLGKEYLCWATQGRLPHLQQDLLGAYIALIRSLDTSEKKGASQARWALRRVLGFLRRLRDEKRLHPVQGRLLPFFEAALKKLPPQAIDERLESATRAALEGMDYQRLAELLVARKQARLFVQLLGAEARGAAAEPWVRQLLRQHVVLTLAPHPKLLRPVLAAARETVAEEPGKLPEEGRALLAWLARCTGDTKTTAALAPAVLTAPPDKLLELAMARMRATGKPGPR